MSEANDGRDDDGMSARLSSPVVSELEFTAKQREEIEAMVGYIGLDADGRERLHEVDDRGHVTIFSALRNALYVLDHGGELSRAARDKIDLWIGHGSRSRMRDAISSGSIGALLGAIDARTGSDPCRHGSLDVYHHFQCLNADCGNDAVVDVRRRVDRGAFAAMPCPFCSSPMDYRGSDPADADGYPAVSAASVASIMKSVVEGDIAPTSERLTALIRFDDNVVEPMVGEDLGVGLTSERLTEMARVAADDEDARIASGIEAEALRDLLSSVERMAAAVRFDDDQDPGLDSPMERVLRGFGRWNALRGGRGPVVADLASARELDRRDDVSSGIRWNCGRCGGSFVTAGDVGDAGREHQNSCPSVVAQLARAELTADRLLGEISSVNLVLDRANVALFSFVGSRVEALVQHRDSLIGQVDELEGQHGNLSRAWDAAEDRGRAAIADRDSAVARVDRVQIAVADQAVEIADLRAEIASLRADLQRERAKFGQVSAVAAADGRARRWPGLRRSRLGGSSGTAVSAAVAAADRGIWVVSRLRRDEVMGELTRLSEIDISSDHGYGFTEGDRDEVTDLIQVVGRLDVVNPPVIRSGARPPFGVGVGHAAASSDATADAGMSADQGAGRGSAVTWRMLIAELGRLIFLDESSEALDRPVVVRVDVGGVLHVGDLHSASIDGLPALVLDAVDEPADLPRRVTNHEVGVG